MSSCTAVARTTLKELAALTAFSYVGFGLRYLSERFAASTHALSEGSPIYPDFYANIIGCCWMGIMVTQRTHFSVHHGALYLGLTTGFAGSLTTFSAWNATASLALYHEGLSVNVFLLQLGISLGMSMLAFHFGIHLVRLWRYVILHVPCTKNSSAAAELQQLPPKDAEGPNSQPPELDEERTIAREASDADAVGTEHKPYIYVLLSLVSLFATAGWLVLFFLVSHWRALWFAFLLSPLGTLIRYYVSIHNKRLTKFPAFTFLVNVLGTLIYNAMVLVWFTKKMNVTFSFSPSRSPVELWLLPAIASGFCGTLFYYYVCA